MNGCVIANTPIAVDFWKVRDCPQAKLFFLTHLHGDHVVGLTSSWHYPIYCSEITGRLLRHKYELKEQFINVLEVRSPSIVYLDREHKEQMTVTPLDANHCPGAVMFLFEGYFGRILHTGDFRFTPQMLEFQPLSSLSGKIDTLFLDNTYCSPKCIFPDRQRSTDMIIDIIKSHPNHNVIIGIRTLGKEDMLCKIALEFKTWIYVPSSFFQTLELLEVRDVFKNNCSDCRIAVVPFHRISNKFINTLNEEAPTIAILPTALYCGIDAKPYVNQDNVFVVPYSDHSSYPELRKFVAGLRPSSIIPIVKARSRGPFGMSIADRADMTCFSEYLSGSERRNVIIPDSVKSFMNNHRIHPIRIGNFNVNFTKKKSRTNNQQKLNKQRGVLYEAPSEESVTLNTADATTSTSDQGNCKDGIDSSIKTEESQGMNEPTKEKNQIEHRCTKGISEPDYQVMEKMVIKTEDIPETVLSVEAENSKNRSGIGECASLENKRNSSNVESCLSSSLTSTKRPPCPPDENVESVSTCHKRTRRESVEVSEPILYHSQGFEVSGKSENESGRKCKDWSVTGEPQTILEDTMSVTKEDSSSSCDVIDISNDSSNTCEMARKTVLTNVTENQKKHDTLKKVTTNSAKCYALAQETKKKRKESRDRCTILKDCSVKNLGSQRANGENNKSICLETIHDATGYESTVDFLSSTPTFSTKLDSIEYRIVDVSAQQKGVRRLKLYRNLRDGMNKICQNGPS